MHPPAGGSLGNASGFLAHESLEQLWTCIVSPRRLSRTKATGVMPSTQSLRLQLFVALSLNPLPLFLLLLLLFAPNIAATSHSSCPKGTTWDFKIESCRPCSLCNNPEAPAVLVPCQPDRDTQCAPLSALRIDWSFAAGSRNIHKMRRLQNREGTTARTVPSTSLVQQAPTTPPLHPLVSPWKFPLLRTQVEDHRGSETEATGKDRRGTDPEVNGKDSRGNELEVVGKLMDLKDPRGSEDELFPKGMEEQSLTPRRGDDDESSWWDWQHWLAAGVSMAVMCALALVLAPSAFRRMRGWEKCSSGDSDRHKEKTKGQFNRIVKSDRILAKGNKSSEDRGHGFYSNNHHILPMGEVLGSGWGSIRQESMNVYVEEAPVGRKNQLPPINSSVLVASMGPGNVPLVRVELQGDNKNGKLSNNCLRLDCASRTMFIGRSSAV